MKKESSGRLNRGLHLPSFICCAILLAGGLPLSGEAQVSSGSNGSDGAFSPATNVVINMAGHPNGIFQYTSVNISNEVTVTFIPNASNTPVVWLVQSNCVVSGSVDVSGQPSAGAQGGQGGPAGYVGGNGRPIATVGRGPGGSVDFSGYGGGSYATGPYPYGNAFLIPLLGGSGGGGATNLIGLYGDSAAGGGGGAILIAANGEIIVSGSISANGGSSFQWYYYGSIGYNAGGGSGGAIRLVASKLSGTGSISASGGRNSGGAGRVRLDVFDNSFGGSIGGVYTQGFQPVIIPVSGQLPALALSSVGGIPVSASPTGVIATPDAVLSGLQTNPVSVVVRCSNLPLNSQVIVSVKPVSGPVITAVGYNDSGSLATSTATVVLNIPRGGGLMYATAASGN
jgi:hypothetical protein